MNHVCDSAPRLTRPRRSTMEGVVMRPLACALMLAAGAVAGCAGLNATQERGWVAFHDCDRDTTSSAALEDLDPGGRVNYRTQEGTDFSSMKACMEARGYACDLGLAIGSRPHTHCYPNPS
jgi:hypothetical protein